ncbi:MAG TPA: AAA family ATPase, partial [Polyangiaceae bacterium]|nr:AAA family ATPase [Polyangiaceae bacterium]
YKKHIEPDPALTRRFQVVQVAEPSGPKALLMMRGVASQLRSHHEVELLDEALAAAVELSARYIPDRQLPDKAVSLLDTACARVAMTQHAVPPDIEGSRRRIDALNVEIDIARRERALGIDVGTREEAAAKALEEETATLETRDHRWKEEKALVERIVGLQTKLGKGATEGAAGDVAELNRLRGELAALQGDAPLVMPTVDSHAVAAVVSEWTGIPTGRMVKNELRAVLELAEVLGRRVVGQSHALEVIARRIQTARARLENPNKPIGVFLLAGPSGVGKTETALGLAEALYGGERNLITINMSEFQESHTVSTLKGAPPGYVGYGEGGVLTEAVRRRPYSVVLLDEVEKAHPDVHEMFFQVFDKGFMEDGQGTYVDFKNTVILLTSNVGTDTVMKLCADPETRPDPVAMAEALRPDLLKAFKPAFLGRMTVVPYYPLGDEVIRNITRLQLGRIADRLKQNYGAQFTYDDGLLQAVGNRCREVESGARNIDHILTRTLLPELSGEFLSRMADERAVDRVHVGVDDAGAFKYEIT